MKQVNQPFNEYIVLTFYYLKSRARQESVGWNFEPDFFIDEFFYGVRTFFGVKVNEIGFPIYDDQEFNKGDLNMFLCWYLQVGPEVVFED